MFFAILAGCIIGGAVVYTLAAASGWYFLGVPIGGAAAWFWYTWRNIRHEAPAVWASVSGWRPDTERWKAIGIYFFWSMLAAASFTFNFVLFLAVFAGPAQLLELLNPILMVFIFTFAVIQADSLERRGARVSTRAIRYVAYKKRKAVLLVSPIMTVCTLAILVSNLFSLLPAFGSFLLRLFVRVHSNDSLDCFLYAAAGVLVGAITTQSLSVVLVSSGVGVGFALVFRFFLAERIKHWWPQFA